MKARHLLLGALCVSTLAWGADWLTEGGDAGRSGWQREEKILNTKNVSGMKLLWKSKVESKPREMHNLFPPLLFSGVTGDGGSHEVAVMAGVSDDMWGFDAVTGRELWHRKFEGYDTTAPGVRIGNGGTLCPGGQTANPAGLPKGDGKFVVYAISWNGKLRQLDAATGKDTVEPEPFTPPNAKPYALNIYKNVIYTSISQGCGGVPYAIFSYDLNTRRTSGFIPRGGGLWGRRGMAVADDGTAFMGTGDGIYKMKEGQLGNGIIGVKLDAKDQLQYAGYFAPRNANWMWKRDLDIDVSPISFDYKGRHLLLGTSKECRLWLLDRDHLGGSDNRTPLDTTDLICNDQQEYDAKGVWGAPATYLDASRTQWIYVPFWGPVSKQFNPALQDGRPEQGGVAAFKLEDRGGKLKMVPAWLSRDMNMAEEAIVANGVVYTYGSGENTEQQRTELAWNEKPAFTASAGQSDRRIALSTHATLFALDAKTGKTLWTSGDQIKSWTHWSGISLANGKLYIPTFDGYLYCFGLGTTELAQLTRGGTAQ